MSVTPRGTHLYRSTQLACPTESVLTRSSATSSALSSPACYQCHDAWHPPLTDELPQRPTVAIDCHLSACTAYLVKLSNHACVHRLHCYHLACAPHRVASTTPYLGHPLPRQVTCRQGRATSRLLHAATATANPASAASRACAPAAIA
jgi:hypothetical protein